MEIDERVLAAKSGTILPHLDERQRRLLMAAEARSLGYGGISLVARAAGVSRVTVTTGVDELDGGAEPLAGRARRPGGGRKPLTDRDAGLIDALDALVEPETRGDPMTRLRWTTKSARNLADELGRQGHQVSHHSAGRLLARGRWSTACRATPRRWKAGSTPTAMPSSATSPGASRRRWPRASR
jgi:Rhodopirellula transposase DDE domain